VRSTACGKDAGLNWRAQCNADGECGSIVDYWFINEESPLADVSTCRTDACSKPRKIDFIYFHGQVKPVAAETFFPKRAGKRNPTQRPSVRDGRCGSIVNCGFSNVAIATGKIHKCVLLALISEVVFLTTSVPKCRRYHFATKDCG
jgi:hypothetical protein